MTAGSDGVTGIINSQTVNLSLIRTARFDTTSSSIISEDPFVEMNSANDGENRILLNDELAHFILST